MLKVKKMVALFLVVFMLCSMMLINFPTSAAAANTDWLMNAKYGVFNHILSYKYNTQNSMTAWNNVISGFDMGKYADQLNQTGAGFVIVTMGQYSGEMIAPNATYTNFLGENICTNRDFIMDLSNEISRRGYNIKIVIYLPACGPRQSNNYEPLDSIQRGRALKLGADVVWDSQYNMNMVKVNSTFMNNWASVIREWSNRYGTRVSGWWFDDCWDANGIYNPSQVDPLYNAAKAGNSNAAIAFNRGVNSHTKWYTNADWVAGESSDIAWKCYGQNYEGAQWHAQTYMGNSWTETGCRYSDTDMSNWVANVVSKQGVVSLDSFVDATGTIDARQMQQYVAIKNRLSQTLPKVDVLYTNYYLSNGQYLDSANGQYRAIMQEDGNFCIYNISNPSNWVYVWGTGSARGTGRQYRAYMQNDGNFCIYDVTNFSAWQNLWATGAKGSACAGIVMQNDGNFCMYNNNGVCLWARQ